MPVFVLFTCVNFKLPLHTVYYELSRTFYTHTYSGISENLTHKKVNCPDFDGSKNFSQRRISFRMKKKIDWNFFELK